MNAIHIRGFKCFVDTKFSMGKLTVLAGVNGAGKTSLLHTIGVLHQTLCETGSLNELVLNGAIVNMGRALDVLNKLNSKSEILFEIELEGQLFPFLYQRFKSALLFQQIDLVDNYQYRNCLPSHLVEERLVFRRSFHHIGHIKQNIGIE